MKSTYYMIGILLMILHNTYQSPVPETDASSRSVKAARNEAVDDSQQLKEVKRHSQGTFTSDYSKYLDSRRAQDFIQWLMNTKRTHNSLARRTQRYSRHAEGTFTNDMTNYLEEKAAKEFVGWLIKGRPKRNFSEAHSVEEMDRRHADGSFTNDINKVLDIIAAQEFLDWVINTQVTER
eukprot:XP_017952577.1 PREDICTED: glucagon isoform X2 [Xenopus tropicalis]